MASTLQFKDGGSGVTEPRGFFAAAGSADIRNKGKLQLDLGIVYSKTPCRAAGVFTKNAVKAAPVLQCQAVLESGLPVHGIVANSGNANACTGSRGKKDAAAMAKAAQKTCCAPAGSFFVCSTGRIGDLLPMGRILEAIGGFDGGLSDSDAAGAAFSECILTSDTKVKTCSATFEIAGKTVTVAGSAKGAGMIQPDMATMLAFLTSDIQGESAELASSLLKVVKRSFNAITVDGDMSTNDTVLLLANGESGVILDEESRELFEQALFQVCDQLAEKIVADGERITKVVELLVRGCASDLDAENVARAIGNSLLVKSSWYGNDPNWGRLMDALGYAQAEIDPEIIDIGYEEVPALVSGTPLPENKPLWKRIVCKPRFTIHINLNLGKGAFRLRATDLTEGYVDFNKSE